MKITPDYPIIFLCEKCLFKCSNKKDYNRHLLTAKHKRRTNTNEITLYYPTTYNCECGKIYKHKSSIYKHKSTCSHTKTEILKTEILKTEILKTEILKTEILKTEILKTANKDQIILDLLAQNSEFMNLIISKDHQTNELLHQNREMNRTIQYIVPKIGSNNTTTNTTNNNQFNIQVFLNEDCKDALNFSDFIKQIQVSLTDLENQAENGYIKGITKLFIENLQGLGMNKRPIHCTDKKRKTLYIKENDEWDKEGSQDILKKGIQEVTRRTFQQLIKEQKIHSEEYNDADSEFSTKCITIQRNLTPNHPRESTISKVIDNITQNTGILEKI